jgi:hypothetical protein
MAVTVLSGTSGALYYKPAGTTGTFGTAGVDTTDDEITVAPYLGFKAGDPVVFSVINSSTGGATTYYVISYAEATGVLKVSATEGGSALDITDVGTITSPNEFQVAYADFAAVGQVQSWSFEISRAEIDVTSIGQSVGTYAPFRAYIPGFADGSGSATIFVTNEDAALSNRMVEDVLRRQQIGCAFRLYTDKQSTEALSRSITMDAVLLTASQAINPDDAQQVEITFRPAGVPTFDFSTSA